MTLVDYIPHFFLIIQTNSVIRRLCKGNNWAVLCQKITRTGSSKLRTHGKYPNHAVLPAKISPTTTGCKTFKIDGATAVPDVKL